VLYFVHGSSKEMEHLSASMHYPTDRSGHPGSLEACVVMYRSLHLCLATLTGLQGLQLADQGRKSFGGTYQIVELVVIGGSVNMVGRGGVGNLTVAASLVRPLTDSGVASRGQREEPSTTVTECSRRSREAHVWVAIVGRSLVHRLFAD
jgi:hypothetical protein